MDDHLNNKPRQGPVELDPFYITANQNGILIDGFEGFGRPGGYIFGVGELSGSAEIPLFQGNALPAPDFYIGQIGIQLQTAQERVAQAATQIPAQTQADFERKLIRTGALVNISPAGQLAARLVVVDALIIETQQSIAKWQAGATKFYGRDIWQTTAQDFVAHAQATGQFGTHSTANDAVRQWRESLDFAERTQNALNRIAVLNEMRTGAVQALQASIGQAYDQHPAGWQDQIDSARANSDQLLADLPDFLHQQVTGQAQINVLADPAQYLHALRSHIDNGLVQPLLPPVWISPGIDSLFTQPPLVKAEMEALVLVVEIDRQQGHNSQFSRARISVLRNETIRHLQELSAKLEALRSATVSSQQQLAAFHAQQAAVAAELERQAAEQAEYQRQEQLALEQAAATAALLQAQLQQQADQAALEAATARLEAWRQLPGAMVVNVPQLQGAAPALVAAGVAIALPANAAVSLSAAIQAAVGALSAAAGSVAASASVLLSGLAVGFIALLWPSSIAPSERRAAVLLPSGVLPVPDTALLDAAVLQGKPITLPFAVTVHSAAQGLSISVVASSVTYPVQAHVIDLEMNITTGAYHALIDTPPRLINVTPTVPPIDASTELPITDPLPPAPSLELQGLTGNVTPGYEALDAELYILRYPAHTGLPSIYLAVERPPVEMGEVGAYQDLAKRSVRDGLDIDHIPSRKALEVYALSRNPRATPKHLQRIVAMGAAVAIPREIHQKHSETYGGRNTKEKSELDGADLEIAVTSNFGALRDGLLDSGASAELLDSILEALHQNNRNAGNYQ